MIKKRKNSISRFNPVILNKNFSGLKRSQVSIFIIVATLILAGVIVFFISKEHSSEPKINPDIKPIYSFVEDCVKKTAENAILDTSKYSGYFISPELSSDNNIAYYFYNGKSYMPSKEEIEEHLSLYMNNMIIFCTDEFKNFPDFEIVQEEISSNVEIKDNEVVFNVDYPLKIIKDNKTVVFDKFDAKVPARLGIIYNSVEYLIEDQIKFPKSICLACMQDISETYEIHINSVNINEEDVLFSIKDEKVKVNNKDLIFNFVNKYNRDVENEE